MDTSHITKSIIALLRATKREGIENLISHMSDIQYFTSPASTKHHSTFIGGLATHSLNTAMKLDSLATECSVSIPPESLAISALLHDLCKANAYILTDSGSYIHNPNHPKGHAALSISIAKNFITLTPPEETMIKFHMGVWGTTEHSSSKGEYSINELTTALNEFPAVKLICMADDIATLSKNAILTVNVD